MKPQKIEELDQTGQTGNGNDGNMGSEGGPLAGLRWRVAVALATPGRLWKGFTGKLMTGWRFVTANKMRLALTILLIATVIGTLAALYLWRREIADFTAWAIDGAITRIRGSFSRSKNVVIIAKATAAEGDSPTTVYDVRMIGSPTPRE